MSTEPYKSAKTVFWIVDNGSSHAGRTSIARMQDAYANARLIHLPGHASWLNQIEIYFSILQRKALTPNDFADRRLALRSRSRSAPACRRDRRAARARRDRAAYAARYRIDRLRPGALARTRHRRGRTPRPSALGAVPALGAPRGVAVRCGVGRRIAALPARRLAI
jgi:hypothetical protein